MLYPLRKFVHTITGDNGKEFACHEELSKALDAGFYFADPYCSWERGLNENTNGLIRAGNIFQKAVALMERQKRN